MVTSEDLERHFETLPDWDRYFLNMIPNIKARSKDIHTQVGCVIVNEFNNIISTGYNSLPAGIDDYNLERYGRPEKYNWMVHAEENGICSAAKSGIRLLGSKIYMEAFPCINCARMIIQAGIKEIIYNIAEEKKWNSPKYNAEMLEKSKQMFYEAHVNIRGV